MINLFIFIVCTILGIVIGIVGVLSFIYFLFMRAMIGNG